MKGAFTFGYAVPVLIITALFCPGCRKSDSPVDQPEMTWLQSHAVLLNSADLNVGEPNFNALREIIGDARLVGLGEATHGTTEFWSMRQKISDYLVRNMGFRAILMEAGFPNSLIIDNYILHGEGSAAAAHEKLGSWRYREMRELIDWMRTYNMEQTDPHAKIHYVGYDCAFHNWEQAIALIANYIQEADPDAVSDITEKLNNYTLEDADGVHAYFVSNQDRLVERTDRDRYQLILRIVENLVPNWNVWYNVRNNLPDLEIRDPCNLENVQWIIREMLNGGKVVIWAHNGHVGNTFLQDNGTEAQMLGSRLKNLFGSDYYVIGTEFYSGHFLAWDHCNGHEFAFVPHEAALPLGDTYACRFHQEGMPLFFLDLNGINGSMEKTDWLNGPLRMRFIGASYCPDEDRENYYRWVSLPVEFDGILFFEETHPTTPVNYEP